MKTTNRYKIEVINNRRIEAENSIARLEAIHDAIIKYGISAPMMEAVDPHRELVDAGICPAYEELSNIPEHNDVAYAAAEGIADKIKTFLIKHKIIREKWEKYFKEAEAEFDKIHSFDEEKFLSTVIKNVFDKSQLDIIFQVANKVLPIFGTDLLIKSAKEMVDLIAKEDPDMDHKFDVILKRVNNHLKPLVGYKDFEELTGSHIVIKDGSIPAFISTKESSHFKRHSSTSIKMLGWKLTDLKPYVEKAKDITNKIFDKVYSHDILDTYDYYYDYDYNLSDESDYHSEIRWIENYLGFLSTIYYRNHNILVDIEDTEDTMHKLLIAAIKAKKE